MGQALGDRAEGETGDDKRSHHPASDDLHALSGDQALKCMADQETDLMIVDLSMPGMNGLELLKRVKHTHPNMPVVIMTAYSSVKSAIEVMKGGAFEYLIKPFGNEEFLSEEHRQ